MQLAEQSNQPLPVNQSHSITPAQQRHSNQPAANAAFLAELSNKTNQRKQSYGDNYGSIPSQYQSDPYRDVRSRPSDKQSRDSYRKATEQAMQKMQDVHLSNKLPLERVSLRTQIKFILGPVPRYPGILQVKLKNRRKVRNLRRYRVFHYHFCRLQIVHITISLYIPDLVHVTNLNREYQTHK